MKKIVLGSCLLIVVCATTQAQNVDFGVTAGFQSAIWYPGIPGDGGRLGFILGGHASIFLIERLVIKSGLVFSQKGAWLSLDSDIDGDIGTLSSDYISLPILAKYYITKGFHAQIGPQISYLTASSSKTDGVKNTGGNLKKQGYVRPLDAGVIFGLGYEFRSTFTFAINFDLSFVNLIKDRSALARHIDNLGWIDQPSDVPDNTTNGALQFVFSYNFTKNRSPF